MLAIPVFRGRVAPVLDWCSKIMLFAEEGADIESGREIDGVKSSSFELMRLLRKEGITTLICGALSSEMLNYGERIGLGIIHGIAGEIAEVLEAYREQKLDQPQFWLPGCRGQRQYKSGARCNGKRKERIASGGESGAPGANSSGKVAGGPGGFCVCPQCAATKPHERGIPCSQVRCPVCQSAMIKEYG